MLDRLVAEGGGAAAVVEQEGLEALDDDAGLQEVVAAAIAANADAERVRRGTRRRSGRSSAT